MILTVTYHLAHSFRSMTDRKMNSALGLLSRNSQANLEDTTGNDRKRMMMIVAVRVVVVMIIKAKHAIKTV